MAASSAISVSLSISGWPRPRRSALWCTRMRSTFGPRRAEVLEVLHADGAPAHLVLVGRADAAPGGADLALAGRGLAQHVELAVQRQDERGVLGDAQVGRGHGHAPACQPLDLLAERPGIDDHAVAEHRELARAHHAGGQQRQLVGLVADDEGVAGVVPALEAHDNVGPLRQPVDDLALALVAPLGADHHHVCHVLSRMNESAGRRPPRKVAARHRARRVMCVPCS